MGLRFRKRIKLFPGLWFNLSKSGISTSIGGKGVTVNFKNGKTKTTVGIPGTGISYSQTTGESHHSNTEDSEQTSITTWMALVVILVVVVLMATH